MALEYDGVFMDDEIEKKYPKAPKEFAYQLLLITPHQLVIKFRSNVQICQVGLFELIPVI